MDGEFDDNWLDYELRTNGFCEMVNQVFPKQKSNHYVISWKNNEMLIEIGIVPCCDVCFQKILKIIRV